MYIAFKTQASNPNKPSAMPSEWPWSLVIEQNTTTPPDQSGEWQVLTKLEFEGYKAIHRPAYNLYVASAQAQEDQIKAVEQLVKNAIHFGNNLVTKFAGENILLGITQAGKTKAVADYLTDVMRYVQTGSLYEVIGEIDRLIANGIPSDLSPFVTESRMQGFKQKVVDYLS